MGVAFVFTTPTPNRHALFPISLSLSLFHVPLPPFFIMSNASFVIQALHVESHYKSCRMNSFIREFSVETCRYLPTGVQKKGYTFTRGTQTALNHEGSKVKTINVKNRGGGSHPVIWDYYVHTRAIESLWVGLWTWGVGCRVPCPTKSILVYFSFGVCEFIINYSFFLGRNVSGVALSACLYGCLL